MASKVPPLQIQQQLSKEANYGCIVCGCPVLEFIVVGNNDSPISAFLPENMVAICPSDHIKYTDGESGERPGAVVRVRQPAQGCGAQCRADRRVPDQPQADPGQAESRLNGQ